MLRIVWKAGCLETCKSGLGLGSGGSSRAYTTCVLPPEIVVDSGSCRIPTQTMLCRKARTYSTRSAG